MPELANPMSSKFDPDQADLARVLESKSLPIILQELKSENAEANSKALEILALYFVRLLGLEFKGWQRRSKKIIRLLAEEAEHLFSRWQIRSQNAADSDVLADDIAEEVGLSLKFKSNVILLVTTGEFTKEALKYVEDIMQSTNLNIIMIGRYELDALTKSPHAIEDILNSKASDVMKLKALEAGSE